MYRKKKCHKEPFYLGYWGESMSALLPPPYAVRRKKKQGGCLCAGSIVVFLGPWTFGSTGKKSGHWLLHVQIPCGIPFRTGFLLEMIPRKPLKLTEGVLENRALHQSESSILVKWVAENLCDPSLNHGMVDGSWGFGCAMAPLSGELRMTRLVPPP